MIEQANPSERALPVSPQLALRVAILGGVALVMFTVIFFRLWYLQILSGNQYRAQASYNGIRHIPIPAPRGEILDSEGHVIVGERETNAVQIIPAQLPPAGALRTALYDRIGKVLGQSGRHVKALVVRGEYANPFANVTIAVDTGYGILTYLSEHQQLFPGVTQGHVAIPDYIHGELAAQMLGYTGLITQQEFGQPGYKGIPAGTIIGQAGLQAAYDVDLRGKPGVERVRVNSANQYIGTGQSTAPTPGHDLRLTINLALEEEGDRALADGFALANANGYPAYQGAFVALDPRTGKVLALGSYPSFDPGEFNAPVTDAEWNRLQGTKTQAGPAFNRAVSGQYPTGSTFKPITAMAGLEAGLITPQTTMGAGSCILVGGDHEKRCNANNVDDGDLDVENALKVSEDTFFYELGEKANRGHSIQDMAHLLGLGKPTGIDLPGETAGVIPDAAWRRAVAREENQCERREHKTSCGISDDRLWSVGDDVNLAVGQGDLEATPLQMAVAYSGLANAFEGHGTGVLPQPYIAQEIDDSTGALVQQLRVPHGHEIHLDYGDLSVVMAGLHDATSQTGGTSADVWAGFPRKVYGKTGTAERNGQSPQAWYVCYLPSKTKPIVIAVTIEQGGFGDESAAPVARLIASRWFGIPGKLVHGSSPTL